MTTMDGNGMITQIARPRDTTDPSAEPAGEIALFGRKPGEPGQPLTYVNTVPIGIRTHQLSRQWGRRNATDLADESGALPDRRSGAIFVQKILG
jgi:hypothetical protein